ncbi:MAG TPA: iron-sulfur cluster assembly accessory protein [Pseudogracilibacillus sp.]|nr:iron-sulfur cluster assembly accessory protein [Pseudogracilibacillus sp.]
MIKITDQASRRIKEMLQNEPDPENVRLRFGVKGGGCSGLSYSLGFDDEINEELDIVDEINGIPVVINRTDLGIVENSEIDFKQNLMGGGFSIKNPNAIFSCGCGSSFRTKEVAGTPGDC